VELVDGECLRMRLAPARRGLVRADGQEQRDSLHWDEFDRTWSKRRRLAREKNELETPRIGESALSPIMRHTGRVWLAAVRWVGARKGPPAAGGQAIRQNPFAGRRQT